MASGSTTIDFGSFPGSVEAQVDVTGQSGFVSTSEVEAWVLPVATSDHSVDEHLVESLLVIAVYKTDGTFTIRGFVDAPPAWRTPNIGGEQRQRLYGQFTVGWAWVA